MLKNRFNKAMQKAFYCLVLASLLVSNVGMGVITASAQDIPTETPTETVTVQPEEPTGTPTFIPAETGTSLPTATQIELPPFTPTIAPTEEMLSTLNLSDAGTGDLDRARVTLKYVQDLNRLQELGIIILEESGGSAVVQVNLPQLAALARRGFEPSQIDSVEYMLAVQSLTGGEELAQADVAASPTEMMTLASVDTDSDGLTDTEESYWCTNPNDNNSDSPNPPSQTNPSDGGEVNAILNGIIAYGPPFALWPQFTPHNPNGNCQDGDFDGAPDYAEEFMIGTSNLRESSDKDKFDDGQELFGVTFCPASSGPCGYGILPRAEDATFVTANLPSWVEAPGNSPFVAAFPEPEVEVVPSSLKLTQVTVITNTNGTTVGTEKAYGTASTTGASTSLAQTETWNTWQSVAKTTATDTLSQTTAFEFNVEAQSSNLNRGWNFTKIVTVAGAGAFGVCAVITVGICAGVGAVAGATVALGAGLFMAIGDAVVDEIDTQQTIPGTEYDLDLDALYPDGITFDNGLNLCIPTCQQKSDGLYIAGDFETIQLGNSNVSTQDRGTSTGNQYGTSNHTTLTVQPGHRVTIPLPKFVPTTTVTNGTEHGGARTTTTTEYEEQTISESSTNQYSDNWSTASAVDTSHSADLRFTYNIVNNGTEYAREVTSLTFNVYIGSDPNPAYTYVAVGQTGQIAKIENLFPGDSLTYTSSAIALTLDEMRAIDEGAPVRIGMEDIAFGQDQVFYQDAFNGSVLVAMEDGFDDNDETIDSYLIPVWDPSDTLQDVVKRYFPVTEDVDGNLLSVSTPEFNTSPATFNQHSLTGTSWWNIYLSDELDYSGAFNATLAKPNTSVLIRIVTDSDLDGYNNRNEIRIGTDPNDPVSHPAPNLLAGYTKSCTGNDCTLRMTFQNIGNYDAYGVEAVLYSPDGLVNVTNNTIGGSGRVSSGEKIVVGPSDTFQYTKTDVNAVEPVIIVSYNDPQGNHRFILPAAALISDLNNDLASLNGTMLPDAGVDISSTSASQANFVINSPHPTDIINGKLFVEYIDGTGNVMHEDVYTQTFLSGPTVVSVPVDLNTYPPASTIILAFFTDSQGNIIDSSARPLASFGPDPLPEVNLTTSPEWEIGMQSAQSVVSVPDPWDFGTVEPGTQLHANITLANTGLGDLRYSLTGWGNGVTVTGIAAGSLSPSDSRLFAIQIDTAGLPPGQFDRTLTLRTNDPNHATVSINIQGTIGTPVGSATAYDVNDFHPWDQFVYVPGPHNQNDLVTFTHTLADDPSRMFPLYLYSEDGQTLKGVGEYGVDFSGQTAPFGVFGTGADGDLTVTSGQTIYTDNTRSAVASTANSGQLNLSLSSASGFAAGQEVIVIQTQGTGAGNYEFAIIASVAGNTLTLSKNLTKVYTVGANSKAQVISVMQYHDVTVQSGGTLIAHAWDGITGGVLVFRSSGALNVSSGGTVSANKLGFRGGQAGNDDSNTQGEGYPGMGIHSSLPNGNGGGGGHANVGAGGGNGTVGASGCDNGNCTNSTGGLSVSDPTLATLFLGGGGGGGGSGGCGSSNGGRGGGIIVVNARSINNSGSITANGEAGPNACERPGGSGSGGTIKLISSQLTLGSSMVSAIGGIGGFGGAGCSTCIGGSGGNGRVRVEYGTLSGTTNPAASTQQVNYYSITGQGAPFGVFGNGTNGDFVVANGETKYTDDIRSPLASTVSAGQQSITLSNPNDFQIGQEVLIIEVQGTSSGVYEFAAITNKAGNTITLSKPLVNTYTTGGNSRAQVIRIPQYQNVTVQSGGILTAHEWDGASGGIVAFRVSNDLNVLTGGIINVKGLGLRGTPQQSGNNMTGLQGESVLGGYAQTRSYLRNGCAGGGGEGPGDSGGGGGGANETAGQNGWPTNGVLGGSRRGGEGGTALSNPLGLKMGCGGGQGGFDEDGGWAGPGGNGGGIIWLAARNITISGTIHADGGNGADGGGGTGNGMGGGGGGAGGNIFIFTVSGNLGNNNVIAVGGSYGRGTKDIQGVDPYSGSGGNGGEGRIYVEYGTLSGATNPSATSQQVNFFNLTGSSSNTLYLPDPIASGSHIRYQLLYGQRGSNNSGGDQSYSVHLPNRGYNTLTLSALIERVAGSGSTFNFCLDFGNDGTCDWNANNQNFNNALRLDSPDLKNALNAYVAAQINEPEILTIPIRVNINTPADIFLFNLAAMPGANADLVSTNLTITPPNGNPPDNIPEGSQVTLSATVTNNGTYKAENFTAAFYNGDPATNGVLIGSTFIQFLAAGATSAPQTVTWNTTGLLGNKTIYVKVDASSAIAESNESNNTTYANAVIKEKADLLITSLVIPDTRQSETGSASFTVKNEGEADVTDAVVKLYDGSPESGILLGSTTINVAQGATSTGQMSFSLATVGAHALSAKVDPDNTILEADETNNTSNANANVGWNLLTIDAGGATDVAYSSSNGAGYQLPSSAVVSCGTQIQQSYRQAGSAETLAYQIDNLLPGRRYHLDLTFATCSGERWVNMFVDNTQVYETFAYQISGAIPSLHVTSTPQTVSILLDPADYADGSITLNIQRASGLNGPLVNIIDLQEITYCYRDSGPAETSWNSSNNCGYDPAMPSDGFNGWGNSPEKTVRFSDTQDLHYKFTSLNPARAYNTQLTFYEGDSIGRNERIIFDGLQVQTVTLSSMIQRLNIAIPQAAHSDGIVDLNIQRTISGDSMVSEVALEENTRLENNRYPAPTPPSTPATPTLTAAPTVPTPTPPAPQVVLSAFTATWSSNQIAVHWETTTEINNSSFKIYRSTDTIAWAEIASVASSRTCGNYTGTTPVPYNYSDVNVVANTTYYYRLQFSGEGCGGTTTMSLLTANAVPPTPTPIASATNTPTFIPTHTPNNTATYTPTYTPTPIVFTLMLQPDAAAGVDSYIYGGSKTTNYGTAVDMGVGEDNNTSSRVARSLIKFDLSAIPANATITSATLSLWTNADLSSNDGTILVYRLKVPFNETQVTWSRSATGINWQIAGASGTNDRETSNIGSVAILNNEALNIEKQIVLTPAKIQEMVNGIFVNKGFIIVADTELNDRFNYTTSDSTNASQRPKLVIQYTLSMVTPTDTATSIPTPTGTAIPPTFTPTGTATHTATPLPPTATFTSIPPTSTNTHTPLPPTATFTPTSTPVPPTFTNTATPLPPTATDTPTNTPTSTATTGPSSFPSTSVLDNFNRVNGAPGKNWGGATAGYGIVSNRLDVGTGGALLWKVASFGTNQEVFVTLTSIDTAGSELDLLLKSQSSTTWSSGVIKVLYDPIVHIVQVWTYSSVQGWVQRGADIPVTFANGDQFGARAKSNGMIEIYRNGAWIGSRDASGWTYSANGGYVGLWFINAGNALLDDSGGGIIAP